MTKNKELFDAFYYLNMSELKKICHNFGLPDSPPKGQMIERIKHFLSTGKILKPKEMPEISKALKNHKYKLSPDALMLKGAYKNDAQTRTFFKKLIGNHFHFTAFGIDWLNEQWMKGKPPTYQEFATMWQQEIEKRKKKKPEPKKEWALINFMQRYLAKHPNASKQEIMKAWKKEREKHVEFVHRMLKELL